MKSASLSGFITLARTRRSHQQGGKNNNYKSIRFLPYICMVIIFINCEEPKMCGAYEELYADEIRGKVVKTGTFYSKEMGARMAPMLIVRSMNDTSTVEDYTFYGYFDSIKVGDSVYKSKDWLALEFFREGNFIEVANVYNNNCYYFLKPK